MDNYDEWDDLPNITAVNNDAEISHTFTTVNTSGSANKSIKSLFGLANNNHIYGMFEAN